jgi:ribosome maturation factor RimP
MMMLLGVGVGVEVVRVRVKARARRGRVRIFLRRRILGRISVRYCVTVIVVFVVRWL